MKYLFLECLFSNVLKKMDSSTKSYYKIIPAFAPTNAEEITEVFLPYNMHSKIHCYAHKYMGMFGGQQVIEKITDRICNEHITEIIKLYKEYKDLLRCERLSNSYDYSISYTTLLSALASYLTIEDFSSFDYSLLEGVPSETILKIIKNSGSTITVKDLEKLNATVKSVSERDLYNALLSGKKPDTDEFRELLLSAKTSAQTNKFRKGWYSPRDRSILVFHAICRYLLTGDEETLDRMFERETSFSFCKFEYRHPDLLVNFMEENKILRIANKGVIRFQRKYEVLEAYKDRLTKITAKLVKFSAKGTQEYWRIENTLNEVCFWNYNTTYVTQF